MLREFLFKWVENWLERPFGCCVMRPQHCKVRLTQALSQRFFHSLSYGIVLFIKRRDGLLELFGGGLRFLDLFLCSTRL